MWIYLLTDATINLGGVGNMIQYIINEGWWDNHELPPPSIIANDSTYPSTINPGISTARSSALGATSLHCQPSNINQYHDNHWKNKNVNSEENNNDKEKGSLKRDYTGKTHKNNNNSGSSLFTTLSHLSYLAPAKIISSFSSQSPRSSTFPKRSASPKSPRSTSFRHKSLITVEEVVTIKIEEFPSNIFTSFTNDFDDELKSFDRSNSFGYDDPSYIPSTPPHHITSHITSFNYNEFQSSSTTTNNSPLYPPAIHSPVCIDSPVSSFGDNESGNSKKECDNDDKKRSIYRIVLSPDSPNSDISMTNNDNNKNCINNSNNNTNNNKNDFS